MNKKVVAYLKPLKWSDKSYKVGVNMKTNLLKGINHLFCHKIQEIPVKKLE